MGVSAARMRMKGYFQFSMIAIAFVLVFSVIYYIAKRNDPRSQIDYSKSQLIQYMQPADDAPVVIYETNLGTFKAVLFPEQAPQWCAEYTELVNSGYYDGTSVFAVQDGVYFMGGSKSADGTDTDDTDKTEIEAELHQDLWPFYGAVIAYGNRTSLTNPQVQSGTRSIFVGSIEFTDEIIQQLDEYSNNVKLNEAFKTHGGVPNFSQQYTIFAQVYDGEDVYAKVLSAEVVRPEESKEDGKTVEADLSPKEPIKFERVSISTYGENRRDEFFTEKPSEE
ncbi:MAG: peptidylprolyl isomerase [Ruminococcus sp.]|nr:peptidylprolyl isomerase [Ruminococcus sp.]